MKFPDARKYLPNAFRRGATQELLTTGNSLEFINGSVGWWGSGFRSYIDLGMDHAFSTHKALIALSDSDSSEIGGSMDPHANDKNEGVSGGLPALNPMVFDLPHPIPHPPLGSSEFHWAF